MRGRRKRRTTLALVLLVQGVSASAAATRVALVVVATDQKLEREALELQFSVAKNLATDRGIELIDLTAKYAPEQVERAVAQTKAAELALRDVRAYVERLEYEDAKERAEAALADLRTGDFRVLREPVLELLVRLAAIKNALGIDDHGAAELGQALVISPQLDAPREWNSKERGWFNSTRKAIASAEASHVRLESEGGAGLVWLDGQLLGSTPVTVTDALAGRHYLTFVAPGRGPEHRSELFGAIDRVVFSPQLNENGRTYRAHLASIATGLPLGDPTDEAGKLLAWVQADELLVIALSGETGAPKGTVLRRSTTGVVPVADVPALTSRTATEALMLCLDSRAVARPVQFAPNSQTTQSSQVDSHRSRAPTIVLLASAAAAIVAGGILIGAGHGAYDQTMKTQLLGSGYGVLGASALCAGIGIFLMW